MAPLLTDIKIKSLKPRDKIYRVFEQGLYIEVSPTGGKSWHFKYKINKKHDKIALGKYPQVSLAEARQKRETAKGYLKQGIDPKTILRAITVPGGETFQSVAEEWAAKMDKGQEWTERHSGYVKRRLQEYVYPYIGSRAINTLEPLDFLQIGRRIENKGFYDLTHRVVGSCSQICRYAG